MKFATAGVAMLTPPRQVAPASRRAAHRRCFPLGECPPAASNEPSSPRRPSVVSRAKAQWFAGSARRSASSSWSSFTIPPKARNNLCHPFMSGTSANVTPEANFPPKGGHEHCFNELGKAWQYPSSRWCGRPVEDPLPGTGFARLLLGVWQDCDQDDD